MTKHEVNKWEEELAKAAAETVAELPSVAVPTLTFKNGGGMAFNGADLPRRPDGTTAAEFIILNFIRENQYYDSDYDPENHSSPCCYAFGNDDKTMRPHEKAPKPQHDQCKDCPMNEYGTADKGGGKACKNVMKIAVIPAGVSAADIPGAEVAFAKISVTSVKNFSGYAKTLADNFKRPPFGFVTRIICQSDPKTQFKVLFEAVEQITDSELIGAILEKRKTVQMVNAYPEFEAKPKKERAAPKPGGRFGGARR